ncbi:polyketide synthase [Deinococcus cellulosilyticus]|uniref:Ketosynthase family 3 (KS3) domain-containing protein n=1 Tax=Deinococcus cellulosilyticus (strain DSM 18568 / NBRC 106333 / KACC 11606 / 5516J-15) TaxID=1223518 RepID=A0A511N100_DEIC1|nr:polyketide synthase [Deinococcus cellulosilyticus]GEM46141.1 hypothetical protein DC3_17760 [Deinococcus cellulosilyticus NBRC 106333 = KACC 11606]
MGMMLPEVESLSDFVLHLEQLKVMLPDFRPFPDRSCGTEAWVQFYETHMRLPGLFRFDREYFGITPVDAMLADPQQRLLLHCTVQAFADAGLHEKHVSAHHPVGCYVTAGKSTYFEAFHQQAARKFSEETRRYIGNDLSALSARLSYLLDFRGPSVSLASACSSGLSALQHAQWAIQDGQCPIAVVGGVNVDFLQVFFAPEPGGILSADRLCRPLAAQATGTVFSNGAVVVLLADQEFAQQQGLQIYCTVEGVGASNDGRQKLSFTAPTIEGQVKALRKAWTAAELNAVPHGIEMHATGTRLGDPIELQALVKARQLQFSSQDAIKVGAVKANFGHLNHASGLLALAKCAMQFWKQRVFATPNLLPLNPHFDFESQNVHPQTTHQDTPVAVQGLTSLGIGGSNVHVVLRERTQHPPAHALRAGGSQLVLVGSHKASLLDAQKKSTLRQVQNCAASSVEVLLTTLSLFATSPHRQLIHHDPKQNVILHHWDLPPDLVLSPPAGPADLVQAAMQLRRWMDDLPVEPLAHRVFQHLDHLDLSTSPFLLKGFARILDAGKKFSLEKESHEKDPIVQNH